MLAYLLAFALGLLLGPGIRQTGRLVTSPLFAGQVFGHQTVTVPADDWRNYFAGALA